MNTFDFSPFNSYILKKDNLLFVFFSSNEYDRFSYCNYLEQNLSFQNAGTDVALSSLAAIIILCYGNTNHIEVIPKKQQLVFLIGECNLDIQDRKLIHTTVEQISYLIKQIPVFVLHYTTPENFIKLVYDYLHI